MTEDRPCISNDDMFNRIGRMDRPFVCRRKGMHFAACPDPDTCRGCVPRQARAGMLICWPCWERTVDALARVGELIVHLRSISKPGQALGERVNTSMEKSILMPDTWIAADGLLDALGSAPIPSTASIEETWRLVDQALEQWSDLESIVNTREGAKRALVLNRRMQIALRRWPDSEAQYRHIPYLYCPTCRHPHLHRKAPLEYLDEIEVVCGTPGCDYKRDWFDWVNVYAGIFAEMDKAIRKQEKAEKRKATA